MRVRYLWQWGWHSTGPSVLAQMARLQHTCILRLYRRKHLVLTECRPGRAHQNPEGTQTPRNMIQTGLQTVIPHFSLCVNTGAEQHCGYLVCRHAAMLGKKKRSPSHTNTLHGVVITDQSRSSVMNLSLAILLTGIFISKSKHLLYPQNQQLCVFSSAPGDTTVDRQVTTTSLTLEEHMTNAGVGDEYQKYQWYHTGLGFYSQRMYPAASNRRRNVLFCDRLKKRIDSEYDTICIVCHGKRATCQLLPSACCTENSKLTFAHPERPHLSYPVTVKKIHKTYSAPAWVEVELIWAILKVQMSRVWVLGCFFLIHNTEQTAASSLQLLQLDSTQYSQCSRATTVYKGSPARELQAPVAAAHTVMVCMFQHVTVTKCCLIPRRRTQWKPFVLVV